MSSELKLNFEDSIEVVDRLDGLSCYHYTDATVLSENNIKECRGIIKCDETGEVVCKSFGFTPEFGANDTENLTKYLEPMLSNSDVVCMPALEGCLVRTFYYNDKWYVSTHKKIDAYSSKWGCDKSFGELFDIALRHHFEENDIEKCRNLLDKKRIYVCLLRNYIGNRIVCVADNGPRLQFICDINREDDSIYIYSNEFTSLKPRTLQDVSQMISEVDITKTQGYVFINSNTLESVKILKDDYIFYALLRGNQPNVLYRYIELQQAGDPKNVEYFFNLYPEKREDFINFHQVMQDICINVYRKYRNRYVRKQVAIAPQEQFYIMKELHENFINSEKQDIVTQEKVSLYIHTLPPARVLYLYNSYMNRKSVTGHGNKVTTNDKEKIVSCIYKEDLQE